MTNSLQMHVYITEYYTDTVFYCMMDWLKRQRRYIRFICVQGYERVRRVSEEDLSSSVVHDEEEGLSESGGPQEVLTFCHH